MNNCNCFCLGGATGVIIIVSLESQYLLMENVDFKEMGVRACRRFAVISYTWGGGGLSVTCGRSVVFSGNFGFLHQ